MLLCLFGCPLQGCVMTLCTSYLFWFVNVNTYISVFIILSLKKNTSFRITNKQYKQKNIISDPPFHQFRSSILPLQISLSLSLSLSLSAKTSLPRHEGSRVVSRGYTTRRSSLPAWSKRALTRPARLLNMTTTGDYCPASIPGATQ